MEKNEKLLRYSMQLAYLHITNGWSYILFGIGTYFKIGWMITISSAYIAFLWLPVSPEKIVTFAIAIALLRVLFPNDQKTLAVLEKFYEQAKLVFKTRRNRLLTP